MLPVVDTYVQRHQPLQFSKKVSLSHAEIWSRNTGEPICRNPMEPREEEDRSPERSLWADPDHKAGEKWSEAQGSGGKGAFEKHQKKGWTTKNSTKRNHQIQFEETKIHQFPTVANESPNFPSKSFYFWMSIMVMMFFSSWIRRLLQDSTFQALRIREK